MAPEIRDLIVHLLAGGRTMTLATNRSDGWPQANAIPYANKGLVLYCAIAREDQAFVNILKDSRVSVAIANNATRAGDLQGISMRGKVSLVDNENEYLWIRKLFAEKFSQHAGWPLPNPATAPFVRIVPEFISLLDNSKSIGHSDSVSVTARDLEYQSSPQPDSISGSRVVPAVRPSSLVALSRFAPFYVRGQRE